MPVCIRTYAFGYVAAFSGVKRWESFFFFFLTSPARQSLKGRTLPYESVNQKRPVTVVLRSAVSTCAF